MKNFYLLIIIILVIFIAPIHARAEENTEFYNAGFASGIWYSSLPFFSGQTIRIYTAFQNHSGGDIEGSVEFFDNGNSIGRTSFSAINKRLVETWIDWKVTYGNHAISAKIIDAKRSEIGKPAQMIKISTPEFKSEIVFADNDTDKDGIGDLLDTKNELEEKTIPEVKNTPVIAKPIANSSSLPIVQKIVSVINDYANVVLQTKQRVETDIKNIDDVRRRIDGNGDGIIDILDFNILMVNWDKKGENVVDYNGDGVVDIIDFNILMMYWS